MYCDLVRRAAVQVGAPREQLRRRSACLAHASRCASSTSPSCTSSTREVAGGAVVEMLERLRRALRLLAARP